MATTPSSIPVKVQVIPVPMGEGTTKDWALLCAVVHHGLANLANKAMPARAETVVTTAELFERYLNDQQ